MSDDLRQRLVQLALEWQGRYGIAPHIVSAVSELDAARIIGMPEEEYCAYMADKTAVQTGHDFVYKGNRYQIKAHRPSGKPGSTITNAGKAKNYNWDILIWIRYNEQYEVLEAWAWDRDKYKETFDAVKRISPTDMRKGRRLALR